MEKFPGSIYIAWRGPSINPSSIESTLSPLCPELRQSREISHPHKGCNDRNPAVAASL